MIAVTELGLIARGATLGLLVLWGWVLLRDHRHVLAARMALFFIVAVAGHILADLFPWHGTSEVRVWLFILKLLQSIAPAAFWLFARTWFNDDARIGWRSWAMVALSTLCGAAILMLLLRPGAPFLLLDIAQRLMWLGFALAGLASAYRGRQGDLIEARRRLRIRFIWSIGAFVIAVSASGFYSNLDGGQMLAFRLINYGIPILTAALCATLLATRRPEYFLPSPTKMAGASEHQDPVLEVLAGRIVAHVTADKAWRDERLSITALAAQVNEPEYRVRRAINKVMGHRNFAAFINGFRLDEVRASLADAAQREVPILTIALDAGFGSLGPFNRAFREAEGATPSAWRARALADFEIG